MFTHIIGVISKRLDTKRLDITCITKLRATSKENKHKVSDAFQYYQAGRIRVLNELVHMLVTHKCEERMAEHRAKTLLAFRRLQEIQALKIKYDLLVKAHNKLQEATDCT
jgi:hypothetical protein